MEYKCNGKDRYDSTCRNNKLPNIDYCSFHEYLNDYTSIQLNNLTLCKGCNKWYYLEDIQTCNNCINRGKNNRIKYKTEKILCKKENCTYGKSDLNDYCLKHQIDYFKEETEKLNKKVCYNYKRGCRNQLNKTYNFSKCQNCLKKDRENDHKKRNGVNIEEKDDKNEVNEKIINIKITNDLKEDKINDNNIKEKSVLMDEINFNIEKYDKIINKIIRHMKCFLDSNNNLIKFTLNNYLKKCTNDRCNLIYPIKYFISDTNRQEAKQCQFCRDKGKEKDKKESRLQSKKEWNDNNHDKCAQYWMNYRDRKIEQLGEEYWENNAQNAKEWRAKNPDKVKDANEKKRSDINESFKNYKRDSETKNIKFEINSEEFIELVKKPCYYCKEIQEKGFNGIDKKDCNKGYVKDNITSCCSVCNFIKGTLIDNIFIKRVEHILTYQGYIKGNLYPECFADHINVFYSDYNRRAIKKNLEFNITNKDFIILTRDNCYICGKKYDVNHINGIDRVDNNKGYIFNNIKPCCGECNYMKKNLNLDKFLNKIILISKNHLKDINIFLKCNDIIENINNTKIENKECEKDNIESLKYINKLNKDKLRKQRQREKLKENLGEEEYKKLNAEKIKEYRNSKNIKYEKNIITIEEIRENARLRKQKQRELEKELQSNELINNCNIKKHINRKTPEQIREEARLRKQKSRELMKKKYSDEEYKIKRALELKENRKNQLNNNLES